MTDTCSFCHSPYDPRGKTLLENASRDAAICEDCVRLAVGIVSDYRRNGPRLVLSREEAA